MPVIIDGTTGITTPGLTNTGTETIVNLTTTGNTILGDASTDTLNVGNGGLVKDASGNVGIGTSSPAQTLHVKTSTSGTPITLGVLSNATGLPALSFNGAYASTTMAGIYSNGATSASLYYEVPSGNSHFFGIADSTKMTLDASGNLGLGVTPSAWFATSRVLQVGSGGAIESRTNFDPYISTTSNAYLNTAGVYKYIGSAEAARYLQSSGVHSWYNAPSGTGGPTPDTVSFTQAMTLDASGNLLVGKTTSALGTAGTEILAGGIGQFTASGDASLFTNRLGSDGDTVKFYRATSLVGSISVTTSATAYNTSSDYRLKNTIAPMTGALAKVAALKPVTYKWNADGSDGEGFIAHELAEVVPQCVTGAKDGVDEDGNPQYQGIDTSFLVATLTAALQEQQALITQLTARITALEGAA